MEREKKETTVTVYSNIGAPKVYLNGQELTDMRKGYTDVHYIFDHVVLQEGKNTVKTVVTYQGKEYTDEIEWNYNGERVRNADSSVRNTEHAGW